MAVANAYSGTKITSFTLQSNGSNLYDYRDVKMYPSQQLQTILVLYRMTLEV